ncbi:MAG: xanthine dehydrogenase family protein molybdopterin-binding subunit, partial [Metallosphaera sp.]
MAVIRSNYPRAKFRITKEPSSSNITLITFDDIKTFNPLPNFFIENAPKEYILPRNIANYYGEPIAIVVGRDRYSVQDAIDEIEIEYEPLEAVIDPFKSLEPNAPVIHQEFGTNLIYKDEFIYGEKPFEYKEITKQFRYNRILPSPIEPNAVIAEYNKISGELTIIANTQVPQVFKTAVSIVFNIPRSKIRIIVPDSGGGFGGKIFLKPIVMTVAASIITGKTVKYIETRSEHIISAVHGPDRHYTAKILYKDNQLLGIEVSLLEDFGAYLHTYQPLPILRQIYHLTGAYKMKYLKFEVKGVVTNKPPTGPYRGLGIPPAVLVLENLVDSVARVTNYDRFKLRKENFITDFPATTITGAIYDSGDYKKALELLVNYLEIEKYKSMEGLIGVGIAFALEPGSSLAFQTLVVKKPRTPYYEGVYMKMESSGEVLVNLSTNSMGTGHETTISQIVADVLGLDLEDVKVILGDTAGPPGTGFYGSRFSVVGASAVYLAAIKLKERIRELASKLFNVEKSEIKIEDGKVLVGNKSYSIKEIANMIYNRSYLIGDEIGIEASVVLNSPNVNVADEKRRVNFSSTYGVNAHGVIIRIDEETGFISILKYIVVSDAGNLINPLIVDGQLLGGTVMGIGAS